MDRRPSAPNTQRDEICSPVELDPANRGVAASHQSGDSGLEAKLGAGVRGGLDQCFVQDDPPHARQAPVVADRGELAGNLVTEHAPAEPQQRDVMRCCEPVNDAELVEALKGVREHQMGGHGVAREPVAVHEQHSPAGPGEQRRERRAGASRANDDRVVLSVHPELQPVEWLCGHHPAECVLKLC